jgi:hypothetical protein
VSLKLVGAGFLACIAGGVLVRTLEMIGQAGVLLMPLVGYGIGAYIARTAGDSRSGVVLLSLVATYTAALLTNIPSSYQMFRSQGTSPWLAFLISLPASIAFPAFAAFQSGFYALMLLLSLAAAWRAAVR